MRENSPELSHFSTTDPDLGVPANSFSTELQFENLQYTLTTSTPRPPTPLRRV
jgi:hypothetical protein